MTSSSEQAIIKFLQDPNHKPLNHLLELAIEEDEEALKYIKRVQQDVLLLFATVDDNIISICDSLPIKIDPNHGQEQIKKISNLVYYFNEKGKLENEQKDKNGCLTFYEKEKLIECLTFFMFHILTSSHYQFKAKCIGKKQKKQKKQKNKKNKKIKMDYNYQTYLFSAQFEKADSIIVLIPPKRACVTYTKLFIDNGIGYGSFLPLIDEILLLNKKKNSKQKWGILIIDPSGKTDRRISLLNLFRKFIDKRIPGVGFSASLLKQSVISSAYTNNNRDSDEESISSILSNTNGKRIKTDISNLYFVGASNDANYIDSTLLKNASPGLEAVTKGCYFINYHEYSKLTEDDEIDDDDPLKQFGIKQSGPYDAAKRILKKCGVNYLNSSENANTIIKDDDDNTNDGHSRSYCIKRVSCGHPRYGYQSAIPLIIKSIKDSLLTDIKEINNDEQKQEN